MVGRSGPTIGGSYKTMTALCALMLADAGQVDLHGPVASAYGALA